MAAVAFGEGRLPRRYRGWSLLRRSRCRLRHSIPGCDGWIGYEGREPLPQEQHFITDEDGATHHNLLLNLVRHRPADGRAQSPSSRRAKLATRGVPYGTPQRPQAEAQRGNWAFGAAITRAVSCAGTESLPGSTARWSAAWPAGRYRCPPRPWGAYRTRGPRCSRRPSSALPGLRPPAA